MLALLHLPDTFVGTVTDCPQDSFSRSQHSHNTDMVVCVCFVATSVSATTLSLLHCSVQPEVVLRSETDADDGERTMNTHRDPIKRPRLVHLIYKMWQLGVNFSLGLQLVHDLGVSFGLMDHSSSVNRSTEQHWLSNDHDLVL